jgi:hypothetical protein
MTFELGNFRIGELKKLAKMERILFDRSFGCRAIDPKIRHEGFDMGEKIT